MNTTNGKTSQSLLIAHGETFTSVPSTVEISRKDCSIVDESKSLLALHGETFISVVQKSFDPVRALMRTPMNMDNIRKTKKFLFDISNTAGDCVPQFPAFACVSTESQVRTSFKDEFGCPQRDMYKRSEKDADHVFEKRCEARAMRVRSKKLEAREMREASSRNKSARFTPKKFDEPTEYYMDLHWKKLQRKINTEAGYYTYGGSYFKWNEDDFDMSTDSDLEYLPDHGTTWYSAPKNILAKLQKLLEPLKHIPYLNDVIMPISVFSYQLWRSRSMADVFAAFYAFGGLDSLSLIAETWYVSGFYVNDFIERLWNELKSKFVARTESDSSWTVLGIFDMVFTGELFETMRNMLISIAAMKVFEKPLSKQIFDSLGKPKERNMLSLVREVIVSLTSVFSAGKRVFNGESFSNVFLSQNPRKAILTEMDLVLMKEDYVYTGLPVEGKICIRELYSRAKHAVETCEQLFKHCSPVDPLYSTYLKTIEKVSQMLTRIRNRMQGNSRPTPFGAIVCGPPQMGKSKFQLLLMSEFAAVKGRKSFSLGEVYTKAKGSDYYEGHDPLSQGFLKMPEVGNKTAGRVKAQGDPEIDELCALIDTAPLLANMAFGDKGKVFLMPEYVLIDTNNEDLNLREAVSNAAAVRRRFVYFRIRPKKQFQTDIGFLNSAKAANSANPLDVWHITVIRHEPVNANVSVEKVLYYGSDESDYEQFSAFLRELYTDFLEDQERSQVVIDDSIQRIFRDASIREEEKSILAVDPTIFTESMFMDQTTWMWDRLKTRLGVKVVQKASNKMYLGRDGWIALALMLLLIYFIVECSIWFALAYPIFVAFCYLKILIPHHLQSWFDLCYSLSSAATFAFFYVIIYAVTRVISNVLMNKVVRMAILDGWLGTPNLSEGISYHLAVASYIIGLRPDDPRVKSKWWYRYGSEIKIALAAVAAGCAALQMYRTFSSSSDSEDKPNIKTEDSTDFKRSSEYDESLNSMEEVMGCGVTHTRVRNKISPIWNVREYPVPETKHPQGMEEIYQRVMSNTRNVCVSTENSSGEVTDCYTYVLGMCSNVALINKHSLPPNRPCIVKVAQHGLSAKSAKHLTVTRLVPSDVSNVSEDVVAIQLRGMQFKDITSHLSDLPLEDRVYDGFGFEQKLTLRKIPQPITVKSQWATYSWENVFEYNFPGHTVGHCGLPIIGGTGTRKFLLAIHAAGADGDPTAFGAILRKSEVLKGVDKAKKLLSDKMETYSQADIEYPMVDPVPKSLVHYENTHRMRFFGNFGVNILANGKSRLKRTPFCKEAFSILEEKGFVPTTTFGRPIMKPTGTGNRYLNPYNIAVRGMLKQSEGLHTNVIRKVVDIIVSHAVSICKEKGVKKLCPLTIGAAVNGIDGDEYLRRIKASTGAGFGFPGKKSYYLEDIFEDGTLRQPNVQLRQRIDEIFECYKRKQSSLDVYLATLKDEPRDVVKIKDGKTRVFYAGNVANLVVNRMVLAPIFTLMVEFSEVFGSAVGLNCHRGADDFTRYMMKNDYAFIAGDIKQHDISIPPELKMILDIVIVEFASAMGYNEEALSVLQGVLSDDQFPYVVILGDLFCIPGIMPSGRYGTAELNCIILLIMQVCFWVEHPILSQMNFFDNVRPANYGDDLLSAVRRKILKHMNNIALRDYFIKFGITYTPSSKGDVMVEFEEIDSISFLKRTFKFSKSLNRWIMPLDMNSIAKSLEWFIPSDSVSNYEQLYATITSSLWELFFHYDYETFNWVRGKFTEMMVDHFGTVDKEFVDYFTIRDTVCGSLDA